MTRFLALPLVLAAGLLAVSATGADKLKVVTTIPDLADMTRQIGGDQVDVTSLATGVEDIHAVPMKPSFAVRLNRADAVVLLGLEAEHAFLPALLEAARNPKILRDAPGYIDPDYVFSAVRPPADPHPAIALWQDVVERLESSRESYRVQLVSGREIDWVIQNARFVLQCMQILSRKMSVGSAMIWYLPATDAFASMSTDTILRSCALSLATAAIYSDGAYLTSVIGGWPGR